MNSVQQQQIINFLNQGKALYIESVDIGETFANTELMEMLGFSVLSPGSPIGAVEFLTGNENSFAENLQLNYGYGTELDYSVDDLQAEAGISLFTSQDEISRVIAFDNFYRVISSSVVLGGLKDGMELNKKAEIMKRYVAFLQAGMQPQAELYQNTFSFFASAGYESEQQLFIRNDGLGDFVINNIQFSQNNGFYMDLTFPFTLSFAAFATIPVYFESSISGSFEDILTLNTNQGNIDVLLTANCHAPVLTVLNPEELVIEISPSSYILPVQLAVENIGDVPLQYSFQLFDARSESDIVNYNYLALTNIGYDWIEISESGEVVSFDNGSDLSYPIELSNNFIYWGKSYEHLYISQKGFLTFDAMQINSSLNTPLPNEFLPLPLIAPFWDDLIDITGTIFFYQDAEKIVVQFEDRSRFRGISDGNYTFQVILFHDQSIIFQYKQLVGTVHSCTIGLQGEMGAKGIQLAYNEPFLMNETAVKFDSNPNWLAALAHSGIIEPTQTDNIELFLSPQNLTLGNYYASLLFHSNSANLPNLLVPIHLSISETTVTDENSPAVIGIQLVGNYPNPFNPATTIIYRLDNAAEIELTVYNVKGQRIDRFQQSHHSGGIFSYLWNGSKENGEVAASGVYFYELRSGRFVSSKRMILIK